jgi:hypothetical protein
MHEAVKMAPEANLCAVTIRVRIERQVCSLALLCMAAFDILVLEQHSAWQRH